MSVSFRKTFGIRTPRPRVALKRRLAYFRMNFFPSERYWFIFHIVFAVVIKEIVSDNTKTFSKISICCHQKNAEKFISSLRSSRMVKIYRIFSNSPKNNKNNSALSAVTVNCHSARFVGLIHWMQKHIVLSDPGG